MTPAEMDPLKYSYDVLGEECLDVLDSLAPPGLGGQLPRNRSRTQGYTKHPAKRDLYALLRDHASEEENLRRLWEEVNTIPDWVDWDQIARGQDVFYRYGGVALTAVRTLFSQIKSKQSCLRRNSWLTSPFLEEWELPGLQKCLLEQAAFPLK